VSVIIEIIKIIIDAITLKYLSGSYILCIKIFSINQAPAMIILNIISFFLLFELLKYFNKANNINNSISV
jgi:hypothetical protein